MNANWRWTFAASPRQERQSGKCGWERNFLSCVSLCSASVGSDNGRKIEWNGRKICCRGTRKGKGGNWMWERREKKEKKCNKYQQHDGSISESESESRSCSIQLRTRFEIRLSRACFYALSFAFLFTRSNMQAVKFFLIEIVCVRLRLELLLLRFV